MNKNFNNPIFKRCLMCLPIITLQKLAYESGYSEDAIRSKIARCEFIEDKHYIKSPDGRVHFYVEEYLKWVESNRTAKASKLPFTGRV